MKSIFAIAVAMLFSLHSFSTTHFPDTGTRSHDNPNGVQTCIAADPIVPDPFQLFRGLTLNTLASDPADLGGSCFWVADYNAKLDLLAGDADTVNSLSEKMSNCLGLVAGIQPEGSAYWSDFHAIATCNEMAMNQLGLPVNVAFNYLQNGVTVTMADLLKMMTVLSSGGQIIFGFADNVEGVGHAVEVKDVNLDLEDGNWLFWNIDIRDPNSTPVPGSDPPQPEITNMGVTNNYVVGLGVIVGYYVIRPN